MTPIQIADGLSMVDLRHRGRAQIIGASIVEVSDGVAIIDPGPASTVDTLWTELATRGLGPRDVTAVLVTHIHLDHAGATGTLLRANPDIPVYVHESGARHLVDPSRLIRSATRLFGSAMSTLWGDTVPVPPDALRVLGDRDDIEIAGRHLTSAHTPGHAVHHVSYLDVSTGTAFVGDAAGARIVPTAAVLPATPPPDIDVDLIMRSYRRIGDWDPARFVMTHFGPAEDFVEHGERLEARLRHWAGAVERGLRSPGDDEAKAETFAAEVRRELEDELTATEAEAYDRAAPMALSWYGLARYWRKRWEAEAQPD